jgi:hypothetical protein
MVQAAHAIFVLARKGFQRRRHAHGSSPVGNTSFKHDQVFHDQSKQYAHLPLGIPNACLGLKID